MRIGIMQPYIFPYIGYYQLVQAVDKFVMYDDVNFINKGWINRNNILVNNKAHLFSIPLKDASQNRKINEIIIAEDDSWKKKMLKTIDLAYKKAPYFNEAFTLISDILLSGLLYIHQLAKNSIIAIAGYLDFNTIFIESSSDYNNAHLKGQDRIVDICLQEGADHYINPIGGIDIYSKHLFEQKGIKFNFIKTNFISYRQFTNEFVPNLSIIDILMFNSKDKIKQMLDDYELV